METFDRLRRQNATVIVGDHLDRALAPSERTAALGRGKVIQEGPSGALREELHLRGQVPGP